MTGPSLTTSIDAALAAGPLPLPVHPAVAAQAAALLGEGEPAAPALAALAGSDPALACGLLRAANTAFYAGLPKTRSLAEALNRIGTTAARQVMVATCRAGQRAVPGRYAPRFLDPLWRHAQGCARGARWLAERCGFPQLAAQAGLAGLLHDIGKWQLLAGLGAGDHGAGELGDGLVAEVLACRHVDVGLRLVEEWHLPDEVALAVGRHHRAGLEGEELVVVLVRLANQGCHKLGLGWRGESGLVLATTAEAQFLNLDEIALAEFEIMLEDHFELVATTPETELQWHHGGSR